MWKYIANRVLRWIPTVFVVLLVVYALSYFGAGDPIKLIFLRAPGDVAYDAERIEAMREEAGLNRPFIVQFGDYLSHLVKGDFGNSLVSGRDVGSMIKSALPITLQLGLAATLLLTFIGTFLGVVAALHHNKKLDNIISAFALGVWGIPVFVSGPLLMVLLVSYLNVMDVPYGWHGLFNLQVLLPLIVLSITPMALIIRQARSAVLEVLSEDFIRTARSKGIPNIQIVLKHILRPILTPVVSQMGLITINMLNNAVLIETVFGIPGLGQLTVKAISSSDYPVILALVFIGSTVVLTVNLVVDLVFPLLDPRALSKKEVKEK
ncbi:MAG: ABC transporter permease [Spirochaetia bacterium]|nr:ABC transporter permease [Spirochaetia bacterium]MCF7945514.1 ABC transporter permease [Spirochaetia bacterium]MCF7946809.1 ABC transporter permease [Spirochaetia bacterium]